MLYEKQWEGLRHKWIKTPFAVPKFPDLVDQTIQETEFASTNYWQRFQNQIENLSYVGANVHLLEPKSPGLIGETAQIEDVRGSYSLCTSITPQSDVDIVLTQSEAGTNHWQDLQRLIGNQSQSESRVIFPESTSPQLVDEMAQVGDIRGSYLLDSSVTLLLDADVVHAYAKTGTNHWRDLQRQIGNQSQSESRVIFLELASPQLVDETAQVEDIRGSYSLCTSIIPLLNVDVVLAQSETGAGITNYTQLRKDQVKQQIFEISEQFDILAKRKDNWDGRESQSPTDLALAHAKQIMGKLLDSVISGGHRFDIPSISSDGGGNVTAAWYKDERQLHLQIGEHEAEYFRVWGTNIDTEMEVDYLKPENYLMLWKWLIDDLSFPEEIDSIPNLYPTMEMAV